VGVGLNGEMGRLGCNEMAQVRSEVLFFLFSILFLVSYYFLNSNRVLNSILNTECKYLSLI
jgi:uncharacterized membrane protein YtjA (UPF0391 family)